MNSTINKSFNQSELASDADVLVSVKGVRKKFCRSLKRSLWYGLQDVGREIIGRHQGESLRKDEFWAVDNVSFELRRGECVGLIGHNGAGKTTLLKMLNGLVRPDSGQITMRGRIAALIALGAGFNPLLTGRENVYVNGSVLGLSKKEIEARFDDILDFAEIGKFIDAPVQSYSSGMAVRLGFAVAAHLDPDVLLLDEVLAVGDMAFQAKCYNTLAKFREMGASFILVSHNMHHIIRYCQKVVYLRHGKTIYFGDVEAGVQMFMEEMDERARKATGGEADVSNKPCGSGLVRIKEAWFENSEGVRVSELTSGDEVTLCCEFEAERAGISDVVVDIVVRDQEGVVFQGTNHGYGVHFNDLGKHGKFTFRLLKMPLVPPQAMRFAIALLNGKTNEVYDWKEDLMLRIVGEVNCLGRFAFDCEWGVLQS